MAAKTYRQVLDDYDRAKAFGEKRSLADYSRHLNQIYGTEDYTAGIDDGWWKRTSTRIDQALEPTLGAATAPLGEAVGSAFGYPAEGKAVGAGLPRALIQSAPLYLLGPEAGIPATAAALGLTGAAFGAQTYADTGSPKAAAISGVTAAGLPLVGRYTGGVAGKLAGGERVRIPGHTFGSVVGSEAAGNVGKVAGAQFAGSQAGMFGAQVGSTYAQRQALGEDVGLGDVLSDPSLWLGQIPFTVWDTVQAVKHKPVSIEKLRMQFPELRSGKQNVQPEKPYVPSPGSDEGKAQLEALLTQLEVVKDDPAAAEEVLKNLNLLATDPAAFAVKKATQQAPPVPNISVIGKKVKEGPAGWWRVTVDTLADENGADLPIPENKTIWLKPDKPPVFNQQLGVWTWQGPKTALGGEVKFPLLYDLPLPRAELPERAAGVEPTARQVHVPSEAVDPTLQGLRTYESPELRGQEIDVDEANTLVQHIGVEPQVVAQLSTNPNEYVPALEVKGQLHQGLPGETHQDILNRVKATLSEDEQAEVLVSFLDDTTHKFANKLGQEITREQLQQAVGVVDSQGLARLQQEHPLQVAAVKQSVQSYEQAQERAANAQRKQVQPLDSAEAIAEILQSPVAAAAFRAPDGTVFTAAWHGPAFDQAAATGKWTGPELIAKGVEGFTDREGNFKTREEAYMMQKAAGLPAGTTGKLHAVSLADTQEMLATQVKAGAFTEQAVETARLVATTTEIDAATQEASVAAEEARAIVKPETGRGQEQNVYEPVLGPTGQRAGGFATRAEALEYQQELGLGADAGVVIRNAGRRAGGEERGFYLARVVNRGMALDKPMTETGATLHEVLAEQTPQMQETSPETQGEVADAFHEPQEKLTMETLREQLDVASNHPRIFAEATELDMPEAMLLLRQSKIAFALDDPTFNKVNAALAAAKIQGFLTPRAMQEAFRLARQGALEFLGRKSPHLGSTIPHDEALVQEIGIRESLTKAITWLSNEWIKSTDPYIRAQGRLVKELLKAFPGLDGDVDLGLPGMTGWHPTRKWMFWKEAGIRSKINVAHLPFNRSEATEYWGRDLVHEVVHHATRELAFRDDPAAVEFRKVLTAARKALSETKTLPKKVRALIKLAQDEDHAGKLARGEWTSEQLRAEWYRHAGEESKEFFQIIYGLTNDHELLAQTFGDVDMIALARNTQMPKGLSLKSVLDYFVEGWNKFFGKTDPQDNVLAQMLSSFDQYLVPRMFADGYNGRDYIREILIDTYGTRDVALASRMHTAEKVVNTGLVGHSILGFQREDINGLLPVSAKGGPINESLRATLLMGLPHDAFHATMDLLASELPVARELWWRMNQDVQMAKQTHAEIEKGNLPGSVSKDAKLALKASELKVLKMKEALDKQAMAVRRMQQTQQLTVEGWEAALMQQTIDSMHAAPPDEVQNASELRKKVGLDILEGRSQASWIDKTFMLTQHFKEKYPAVKSAVARVFEAQGKAVERAKQLTLGFFYDPATPDGKGRSGSISDKIMEQVKRVRKSTPMAETTSELFRFQNKEGKMQLLDANDPFVKDALKGYKPEDQQAILQVLKSQANRHKIETDIVMPHFFGDLNRSYTAHLIGSREVGMQPLIARDLSHRIYEALAKTEDPTTMQLAIAELQGLAGSMTPDTYLKALQHATQLSQKTAGWLEKAKARPGWTPEQRYGKHVLLMYNPKTQKRARWSSDTIEELAEIQRQKDAEGYELLAVEHAEDTLSPRMGMREDYLRSLEELDQANEQIVGELMADLPELKARVMPRLARAGDVRSQIEAASPLPKLTRRFAEGRETINMLDNADQFYNRINNWMKNKIVQADVNVELLAPELAGNRELTRWVQQHTKNFTTPDNALARKFVEATYFYKLAFDLGNAALESTQNLTTGMHALIGETGSVGQAFDLWGKSVAKIVGHMKSKSYGSKELDAFMEWADNNGYGGYAAWNDVVDTNLSSYYKANGVTTPFGYLQNAAQSFSRMFTRYNAHLMNIAAFELGQSRGLKGKELYDFAVDVKGRGLFDVGKAQRPVGLYGISSRPVPQLLGALQNYTFGWFGQMALSWKKGFSGKPPAGMTETQRVGAKKAFFYSLAAQAALAGALGLPGVGQGLALLNQVTGLDLKGKTLQTLAEMFGEDTQYGGTLTSLALRGIGAYGLPFDPSNRASISVPFLGVDAYKGFNVANLGGAATSTVADFVEGLMGFARGDIQAGAKMLPNAAKRPFQLAASEGDVRDERGTLLYQLSPVERFAQTIGLAPSRVQAARDTADAVKKMNIAAQRQRDSFVDSVAATIRQGDVQKAQFQLQEYLQEHPEVDAQSLVRSVAGRVEAQSVPYDWRRDVNPGVELAGLGASITPSSEMLRRDLRSNVMSELGLPEMRSPQGDYRAMMLDQLMNEDPHLGRSRAMRQLDGPRRGLTRGSSIWQTQ